MNTHAWMHAGWAVAASAAFYIGYKASAPHQAPAAEMLPHANPARADMRGSEFDRSSRNRRNEPGPLETLFSSDSPDRVSLKTLTTQAVTDPSPIARRLAFARILESMTTENALEIREQLVALKPDPDTWTAFNYAWGALAGREAFEFARTSEESDLNATLMGWAAADPTGAMAAMASLPAELEGQRAQLEQNLVAGLADHDLTLATRVAIDLSAGANERQTRLLMRSVANEALRTGGTQAASTWVTALPDGEAKGQALRRVTEDFVREDPAAAAAWATGFAAQDYAASAVGEIGDEWAETDAESAVAWLETLPQGSAQNRGFSEALGEWEDRNPQAAGEYLMAMERSPQRDAAIAGFAQGYAWQDPQTAIAWAQDIADPALRERTLIRAAHAYHRRDPENARAWLQGSGLSDTAKQQALRGRR